MLNFSTALSAMRANQAALQTVANNLANSTTPGYHRQEIRLVDRPPVQQAGLYLGQGVDVAEIHRAYNSVTESAITRNISEQAGINARLGVARELEALMIPGQGNLHDQMEKLFNEIERLTVSADDNAVRSIVIRTAQNLANSINDLDRQIVSKMEDVDHAILERLNEINTKAAEISDLNLRIQAAEAVAKSPNDLLDRRDMLVNELAQIIDVDLEIVSNPDLEASSGTPVIRMADGTVGLSDKLTQFLTTLDENGNRIICRVGSSHPIEVTKGELGGMLIARNEILQGFRNQLEEFSQGLVRAFDTVHATGIGIGGSFESLIGERTVEDVAITLDKLDLVVPVEAGSLFVNVIDGDGNRTLHEVQIDPSVDTVQDVAAKISQIDHLQAVVNVPPGQLSILAAPGYTFDFTGRLPTEVDRSGITGAVVPKITGLYSGSTNDELTFEFQGTGTVGVTPGLKMRVTDQNGTLLAELNVGAGYSPGDELPLNNGVSVSLSPDTVNAGDTFTTMRVRHPDSTGILAALGLNTLFVGTPGLNLEVRSDLLENSDRLATSRSGMPLDVTNAEAMLAVRYESFFSDGRATLEENLADMISDTGVEVQELTTTLDNLSTVGEALAAEQASHSGVDPNEEAVKMLQYQRAFQATARLIVALDEMMSEIMNII